VKKRARLKKLKDSGDAHEERETKAGKCHEQVFLDDEGELRVARDRG